MSPSNKLKVKQHSIADSMLPKLLVSPIIIIIIFTITFLICVSAIYVVYIL